MRKMVNKAQVIEPNPIIIVKFLEHHSKAKCGAPAYSRALQRIKGVVQRVVQGKLRSDFQRVRGKPWK